MKSSGTTFFALTLILLGAPGASIAEVTFPTDNHVPGWTKSERVLRFVKTNLFDYIDGGAELFLEFGFDTLSVQRYRKERVANTRTANTRNAAEARRAADAAAGGSAATEEQEDEIAVEVYQMESADAALGIYLNKCGKETPIPGLKARSTGDRYQFTVVKGAFFLQVNNFGGLARNISVMKALTNKVLESIPYGAPSTLLDRLPKKNLVRGSGLIIRGPYSLQPIFTFGTGDVLQLGGRVFGVLGDYVGENGDVYSRILILYPGEAAGQAAFENLINNLDPYLEIRHRTDKGFSFKDYREKFGVVKLQNEIMEIDINLPEEPSVR